VSEPSQDLIDVPVRPAGPFASYIAPVLLILLAVAIGWFLPGSHIPKNLRGAPAQRLQSLLGLCSFIFLAYLLGRIRNRRASPFPWRALLWGVALQFAFGALVLKVPDLLEAVNQFIKALLDFTAEGAKIVFGNLIHSEGVPVLVKTADGHSLTGFADTGAYFAFFVLPTILFFSTLTAIAWHTGVMQYVVQGLAWIMSKSMRTSGAETLTVAANIFVGQAESPLIIKPFLNTVTNSELMCIMVAGFANIASGVLGLYTLWLGPYIQNVGGHLAAACFISAPASLLISKLLLPETTVPQTAAGVTFKVERTGTNIIDAATRGTSDGLGLALNVAAMLVTFTAIVALLNFLLTWVCAKTHLSHGQPLTLQQMLSYPMSPLAWLSGVSWHDSRAVGSLLGIKTVLNELLAYNDMRQSFSQNPLFISPRSALIAAYSLCGFANFASIGIQVGGISTLAPSRRTDLSRLGLMAMIGGAIASFTTASVIGVLL
jgi:CNT family concentrative nucleoside transporter